jgi:hypothetical protein
VPEAHSIVGEDHEGTEARFRPPATPRQLLAWRSPAESKFPPKLLSASPQRRTRREGLQQLQQEPLTPGQAAGTWNIPSCAPPSSLELYWNHRHSPRRAAEASGRRRT